MGQSGWCFCLQRMAMAHCIHLQRETNPPVLQKASRVVKVSSKFLAFFSGTLEVGPGSHSEEARTSLPVDSIMAWYLSLESGKCWFPVQVYNRENGNIGFMLSCYDAEVSYDFHTDTFRARYPSNGRRTIEERIEWRRIRAPAVNPPAHVLHVSDCLHDLRPGYHIEIQWRKSKEFPYGWWNGVVGTWNHAVRAVFIANVIVVTVILDFKHYAPGSRLRQTEISRKDHRELGNEADGFYGGVRKRYKQEEISAWKCLWLAHALE